MTTYICARSSSSRDEYTGDENEITHSVRAVLKESLLQKASRQLTSRSNTNSKSRILHTTWILGYFNSLKFVRKYNAMRAMYHLSERKERNKESSKQPQPLERIF